jgi:hypothetical protein
LTKHADEAALRCPVALEETDKANSRVVEVLEKNAFIIADAQVDFREETKSKICSVRNRTKLRNRLGKVTRKLLDLESCSEPEKPLNVDLDLYQMENF